MIVLFLVLYFLLPTVDQEPQNETHYTGVHQGNTLFIQNPFDAKSDEFCISEVYVNGKRKKFNTRLSALVLDFDDLDLFTPVSIRIIHKDSCNPVIINPDAIFFHTTFSFKNINVTDSLLSWKAVGDKPGGQYIIEKYADFHWKDLDVIDAKGRFEGTSYEYVPYLEEGANKFRIKYVFPDGSYLYSRELDIHFYPEPVTFSPKRTSRMIRFSRSAQYEIYDPKDEVVLEGVGNEVDVSRLWKGEYVIYFDGKDPGTFIKE